MAAVLYWRLTALTPTNPGPLPWLPGIPQTLHHHPVWGGYLAKRSQLVTNLADQVQDHACQATNPASLGCTEKPPEHSPHRRNRGMARRQRHLLPTTLDQPEREANSKPSQTLCKQHLDWQIVRATYPPANARFDERQAAHTAPRRRHDHRQRRNQRPGQRPNGPAAPGREPPSSCCAACSGPPDIVIARSHGSRLPNRARSAQGPGPRPPLPPSSLRRVRPRTRAPDSASCPSSRVIASRSLLHRPCRTLDVVRSMREG